MNIACVIFLLLSILLCSCLPRTSWLRLLSKFLLFLNSLLIALFFGADYFTGVGINDAVIYHLSDGLKGAAFAEYWLLTLVLIFLIMLSPVILLSSAGFGVQLFGNKSSFLRRLSPLGPVFLLFSALVSPASLDLLDLYRNGHLHLIVTEFGESRGVTSGHKNLNAYVDDLYVPPSIEKTTEATKNIVYIYAESLERTYFDDSIFPGMMPLIKEVTSRDAYDFTDIVQIDGTGWTIAGMVASQCTMPLYSTGALNITGASMDSYLPRANCLGDLLSGQGYHLAYYGGANLRFAGKGKFYLTHGFDEVKGFQELYSLKDNMKKSRWGLYDDTLLPIVFDRFIELSQDESQPFALFTLTLDTHNPQGLPTPECTNVKYRDGTNAILNAVKCSDLLISRLITKIINSQYAENTIIVLSSDHLAMKNTAWDILSAHTDKRRNMFFVIDPSKDSVTKRIDATGSTLDIAPTIMPFVGFSFKGGLGVNLLEKNGFAADPELLKARKKSWRKMVIDFWDFPSIKQKLLIRNNKLVIDGRSFATPVLVTYDEEYRTSLTFRRFGKKSLAGKINGTDPFILVDRCEAFFAFKIPRNTDLPVIVGRNGRCLFIGRENVDVARFVSQSGQLDISLDVLKAYIN